jgi:uncharacterized membrane protein YagU involved in acid resistance
MNVLGAIVAGLAGTAVMTMLMYAAPLMGMPKMDIAGMLGTMFVSKKQMAVVLGMIMHFVAGVIFALVYALLWSLGLGSATWWWGLIFGAVHGIIAIVMIPIIMRMHPRKPEMAGRPMVMAGQLMGHLVYGLVVALVYAAF